MARQPLPRGMTRFDLRLPTPLSDDVRRLASLAGMPTNTMLIRLIKRGLQRERRVNRNVAA